MNQGIIKLISACLLCLLIALGVVIGAKVTEHIKNDARQLTEKAKEKGYLINTNQ